MAKSKNFNDFMLKRFKKNCKDVPKNMNTVKSDLIAKMKKDEQR